MDNQALWRIEAHENTGAYEASSPWYDLAAAIIREAAIEYQELLRKLWRQSIDLKEKRRLIIKKMELEEFFYSGWFGTLTDIEPDRILYRCRVLAREKEKDAIKLDNKRKIKKLLKSME